MSVGKRDTIVEADADVTIRSYAQRNDVDVVRARRTKNEDRFYHILILIYIFGRSYSAPVKY